MAEEESTESGLQAFVSDITRPSRKGDLENLLSTELFLASVSASPLLKVRHILEGFMLLNDKEAQSIEVPSSNIYRMYTVCVALSQMVLNVNTYNPNLTVIPFPFSPEEAYDYLDSFLYDVTYDFPEIDLGIGKESLDRSKPADLERLKFYYLFLSNHLTGGTASRSLCVEIQNRYITKIMPIAIQLSRRLITFLSPEAREKLNEKIMGGKR